MEGEIYVLYVIGCVGAGLTIADGVGCSGDVDGGGGESLLIEVEI